MPSPEDITNQQELLTAYRRTLAQYLKQQALISKLFTPPAIANGIDEARANIRRVKGILQDWDVPVDDHPDDEEPAAPPAPSPARPISAPRAGRKRFVVAGVVALVALLSVVGAGLLLFRRPSVAALRGNARWTTCDRPTAVFPGSIAPEDTPRALEQIKQAIENKQTETWPVAGPDAKLLYEKERAGGSHLYITTGNITENTLVLSTKAFVSVSTADVTQHVDVVSFPRSPGCGGGDFRHFSSIALQRSASRYGLDSTFTDNDYLSLQAREIEIFSFPFECQGPGVYSIELVIRYENTGTSTADTTTIVAPAAVVCPQSFTYWPLTYASYDVLANTGELQFGPRKDYVWDGTSYVDRR